MRILQPLNIPPGFDKRSTGLRAEGRWVDGDKVRSVGGVIESMGGWEKFFEDETFLGICRQILAWRSLSDIKNVALGTHRRLYALIAGTLENITPLMSSGTLGADPFDTTDGSATVNVSHTAHGVQDGAFVDFDGASAVGGIAIGGTYPVASVIDADNYEIEHSSAATSTATGGGSSVDYEYEINPGLDDTIDAFGYGVGGYGLGTYGTPRTAGSILLRARTWTIDNRGEDLIACPRDGNIYLYDYSAAGRAALVANAPTNNVGAFVAAEGHVVAYGAAGDRMRVDNSDIDDITLWAAAADNQANSFNLIGGSELIAGRKLRAGYNLIWSNTDLFRMLYLGGEPWWSFRREGSGLGIAGPNAGTEYDGTAYWMGSNNFYLYDGFGRELPNQENIKSVIFAADGVGVDKKQRDKAFCTPISRTREILWLYQSYGSTTGDIDRYVLYNIDEREFYTGSFEFTAWTDAEIYNYPLATLMDGYVYETEKGTDADGVALRKFIETGLLDVGDGLERFEVFGFVPDFHDLAGDMELLLLVRERPQGAVTEEGPETFDSSTEVIDTRASGRQGALRLTSNTLGGKFRIGVCKVEINPRAGKRR